jgi:hypothetical protein
MNMSERIGVLGETVGLGTGVQLVNETDWTGVEESPIGALGPWKKVYQ